MYGGLPTRRSAGALQGKDHRAPSRAPPFGAVSKHNQPLGKCMWGVGGGCGPASKSIGLGWAKLKLFAHIGP